jgi:hypothetical protein
VLITADILQPAASCGETDLRLRSRHNHTAAPVDAVDDIVFISPRSSCVENIFATAGRCGKGEIHFLLYWLPSKGSSSFKRGLIAIVQLHSLFFALDLVVVMVNLVFLPNKLCFVFFVPSGIQYFQEMAGN